MSQKARFDPENYHHNHEIFEYESQEAREAMACYSPPHKKISILHLENNSPEKKAKTARKFHDRLFKRRMDVYSLQSKTRNHKRKKFIKIQDGSRNKIRDVHEGDKNMYHHIKGDLNEFYTDFNQVLLEKEHFELELPSTPLSTPEEGLKNVFHFPCAHEDAYNDVKKLTKVYDIVNSIWIDDIKDHDFHKALSH